MKDFFSPSPSLSSPLENRGKDPAVNEWLTVQSYWAFTMAELKSCSHKLFCASELLGQKMGSSVCLSWIDLACDSADKVGEGVDSGQFVGRRGGVCGQEGKDLSGNHAHRILSPFLCSDAH